jgi:hypothetical protein
MNARRSLTLLALTLVAVACSLSGPGEEGDPLARLEMSRAKWVADSPSSTSSRCADPAASAAESAGVVVASPPVGDASLARTVSGSRTNPGSIRTSVARIDRTYILAGAKVEAEYDGDLGYPRLVSIDPVPDAVGAGPASSSRIWPRATGRSRAELRVA